MERGHLAGGLSVHSLGDRSLFVVCSPLQCSIPAEILRLTTDVMNFSCFPQEEKITLNSAALHSSGPLGQCLEAFKETEGPDTSD